MKKTILLFLVALFSMGALAKVSVLKSNFGAVADGAKYEATAGEFSWKQAWSNSMDMFTGLVGQVGKYKHLKMKVANPSQGYRLLFYKGSVNYIVSKTANDTDVDIDISTLPLSEKEITIDEIDRICIAGLGGSGSLTINPEDVTLETDDMETLAITTTVDANSTINTPFPWYKGDEPMTGSVMNNFGKVADAVLWGYYSDNKVANGYFNLNGYSTVKVNAPEFDDSKNKTMRLLSDDGGAVITMTGKETIATFNVSKCTSIKGPQGGSLNQNITSFDFIGEYQANNTASAFSIAASKGSSVTYDRIFTKDRMCTICLPFALTAEEVAKLGEVYSLSSVSGNKASFTAVDATEAYTPYLLIPAEDGKLLADLANRNIDATPAEAKTSVSGGYSFVGTLQAKASVKKDGVEIYGFSADEGKFVHVGDNVSIDAFRAYISVPSTVVSNAAPRSIGIDFGGTTGINEIQNTQASSSTATYDIAGKRVGKNYKGVVVSNGKKMIQK